MKNLLATIAGMLAIIAALPYAIDIVKGKTKPNVASWLVWSVLLAIGTSGAFAAHEVRSALLTLGDFIGTGTTLLLGLRYGIAKFSWFDGVCLAGAFLGLVLWLIFNSPTVGIVVVVIVDFIGSVPTYHHSWLEPKEETWQTFAIIIFATILTLVSLAHFSVASLSYPIYLFLANATVVVIVIYRRKKLGIRLSRHGAREALHE